LKKEGKVEMKMQQHSTDRNKNPKFYSTNTADTKDIIKGFVKVEEVKKDEGEKQGVILSPDKADGVKVSSVE
jgi:hypothetical protein